MEKITLEKIFEAYKNARKSRKNKYEVYLFDQNREQRILDMYADIIHAPYKNLILHDSKKSYISSPVFIHHLVYAQIYDTLDTKMVHSSFACRKEYWLHKWVLYLQKILRKERKELSRFCAEKVVDERLYYLKMDFSKYFFSIHHDILKAKIRKYIFNEEILYLIDLITRSYQSSKIYDPLLAGYPCYIDERQKGLPIGWILSQLFANFFLSDFDQFIKHTLKISFVRYMDDVILIGDKATLQASRTRIDDFVKSQKLILHPKKVSFHPVAPWVRFAGYEIRDDNIFAGKRIKLSFQRFMDTYEKNYQDITDPDRNIRLWISSKYFSRTWCFKITNFWTNYIAQRGIVDFHPRG